MVLGRNNANDNQIRKPLAKVAQEAEYQGLIQS